MRLTHDGYHGYLSPQQHTVTSTVQDNSATVCHMTTSHSLTPLAVLMGFAFNLGTNTWGYKHKLADFIPTVTINGVRTLPCKQTLRYCGGTAAMMSTSRGW